MKFAPSKWNVIVVGAWNRALLTPQWIKQSIFKVDEGVALPLEIPVNVRGPWKIKHENCGVLVGVDTLEITVEGLDFGTLETARSYASSAILELPKTPLSAAGFNVRYESKDAISEDFAALLTGEIDRKITDVDFTIEHRRVCRSLPYKEGQINLLLDSEEGTSSVEINFHLSSRNSEELVAWLNQSTPDIEQTVRKILEAIKIER